MEDVISRDDLSKRKVSSGLQLWQEKLLPFMVKMILGLTLFFFVASCFQLFYVNRSINKSPELILRESPYMSEAANMTSEQKSEAVKYQALVDLEAYSLRRHAHLANVSIMARIWIQYLGFVTGMILALVGASFILGKLQIATSSVEAKVQEAELSIKSSSPGLFLVVLGVILMITTICIHHRIETTDNGVYLKASSHSGIFDTERPPVPQIPDGNK